MAEEGLCVGDSVCLFSEDVSGYLYSFQSSSIHNELAVVPRQSRSKPEVSYSQAISFIICVANRYKLNKNYTKLKAKSEAHPDDLAIKTRCTQAEIAAKAEQEDNVAEQKRQLGKKVLYGQVIQLKHVFTSKYIHVSTTQTSHTESSNIQVALLQSNAKHAQFRIMPRYKVKSEGDLVQVGDQVILESVKSPGQYLHVSKGPFGKLSVYSQSHELNMSVSKSGFTVYRRYKPEKQEENMLKAGVPLRLFHKEIEANLCAEGLFDDDTTEDVHFRVRSIDESKARHLSPATSAIVYWQVDFESGPVSGAVVRWEQQCRFKHLTTRQYLCVNADKKISLTTDCDDPKTVFRLHPVIKESDQIEFDTYCRIEHVVTGSWLHALPDEYKRKQVSSLGENDLSMAALQWTHAPLKQIGMSSEMQYDDAFTLQQVEECHVEIFNYIAGMVPFIHKVIADKKAGLTLNTKQAFDIIAALRELKDFMIVNSVPNKERQKLLRNLRIVDLLVKLLQIPYRGTADQLHMVHVLVECYNVLYTYLMGDSRKNELYIAKYIDFFNSQISFQGDIGLNAAKMVMELLKDNRKIVDRITHDHIDNFVNLLREKKNYRYLDLLSVLCVCDGMSIPDNQTYITQVWLMKGGKDCVYNTDLGQKIGRESQVVFISTNNQRSWQPLHEFVQGRDLRNDEEYLFLEHQLSLFGNLAFGRNSFAIRVITEELCYLSIDEAFLCLTNDMLPDELRTVYCSLIIDLSVDVGDNKSVLDTINLTFIYDNIGNSKQKTARSPRSPRSPKSARDPKPSSRPVSGLKDHISLLRSWLSNFLAANMDMTASMIGHNTLVEQVLRLVHCLVSFGYYGDMDDMKQLLIPLLSLLDGRNDKLYPEAAGVPVMPSVRDHYRAEARFKQSPETKAIVDAKYQALRVLDLFLNFQFNTRLVSLIQEFKSTYVEAHHSVTSRPELGALLNETFSIDEDISTNRAALKRLAELFQESDYLGSYHLTDILLDLSNYDYDMMIVKSMGLLNRFYSTHDNLFSHAVQAQILITDASVDVLNELQRILPEMCRLTSSKMSQDQMKTMLEFLDKLTRFCSLEDEPEERHAMNQSILYNHRILDIVFDILSQEIDIKLKEQYQGMQEIFRKCFSLLKAMARENALVQQRLFDRLDMLLHIKGAESEMAEALIEVFTGNKETCLKIMPHHIQEIMSLVATHTNKAPQFLDLLNAIVKVEELNLPLKRNQAYVMKYFMQYRTEVAYVIDQAKEQRLALLKGPDCPDLNYLVSMVDLLATCAEGENRFIESICQTIFSLPELLDILNDSAVCSNLKRPYVRFLLWVYLNTASGMVESGAGDLPHSGVMWLYLNSLNALLADLTKYAEASPETVKQLLKKAPGKASDFFANLLEDPDRLNTILSERSQGEWKQQQKGLHYILDSVLPLLQVFFRACYQPNVEDFPNEADYTDTLAKALVEFMRVIGPLISNPTHMKTLVSCMNVMMSISTLPLEVMQEFQEKYGSGSVIRDISNDAKKKYIAYYQQEEELNDQLNTFAVNYSMVYGGLNTIRTQIGYPSDADYTELGGDEELPLGQEFQDHINCFLQRHKKLPADQYKLTSKLIKQLAISGSNIQMSEKDRLDQEILDIKCLQLLRGLIHNETVILPDNWELNIKTNARQLQRIKNIQNVLNSHDAVLMVLPHLSTNSDSLVREVLAFLVAMLYGGNTQVQRNFSEYFLGTREEKFFFAIKSRMLMSTVATREKRSLHTQHQAKVEEAVEQAKALRKAMKAGQVAAQEILSTSPMATQMSQLLSASSRYLQKTKKSNALKARYNKRSIGSSRTSLNKSQFLGATLMVPSTAIMNGKGKGSNKIVPQPDEMAVLENLDDEKLTDLVRMSMADTDLDYHDDGYIEIVLKMMGLMCDNQNTVLQDYLREQPDNIKSVNLIAETSSFLGLIYSSINAQTISLVTELFNTLIEFTSGNYQNQLVVFDNKVCDYINYILRGSQFHGCSEREVLTLKKSIAMMIVALIEEDISQCGPGAKEVCEALDAETIWHMAVESYQQANSVRAELKEDLLELGFRYYHILCRMRDLYHGPQLARLNAADKNSADKAAWTFYERGTLSIEIVKDGGLQKIHFTCMDKTVLREDVKEKFKYDVDRSSPSSKLRELIDWSGDILYDIKYTRKVYSNPVMRFFVKYWWHYNIGMILMSFLFCVLIMVTWKQPADFNSIKPVFNNEGIVTLIMFILSITHNVLAFCVLISFFITKHPTLPHLWTWFKSLRKKYDDEDVPEKERSSNLEVKFFSFLTFWYLLIFAFSVLGLLFYGYFFSFHLLHIAEFNQLLKRTIRAITQNGGSLMWVFIYGLIVIYIYALIGFAFYRELFDTTEGRALLWVFIYGLILIYIFTLVAFAIHRDIFEPKTGHFCDTFYQCMVTSLRKGLIDGLYDFLAVPEGKPFTYHLHKAVFDVTFFIIITTIGLNIIFGIIVDTFSELRDNKLQVEIDMHRTCFICSRSSYDFEHHGKGFEHHVREEHNQWAYVFFFIHLNETRTNDYTALELYISRLLTRKNYDFFPLNRALSLQQELDENEIRLETLVDQVSYLVNKTKQEEAAREREDERQRQKAWAQQNRAGTK